jgi:two-component sensor histidine kinase
MSALNIQGRSCAGLEAESAIREARSMIMTVLTLNEMFSMSETLEHISVKHYITKLARRLFEVYGGSKIGITLYLEINDVHIPSDILLPCGMITNELIMNALKHAFSRNESGSITVSLSNVKDGMARLSVKDDGCGVISLCEESLGLKMVKALCSQLGGTFEVSHQNGTECSVEFET